MKPPKALVLAILRDVAYDASLRERLGLTRAEVEAADRWANAMPEWPLADSREKPGL